MSIVRLRPVQMTPQLRSEHFADHKISFAENYHAGAMIVCVTAALSLRHQQSDDLARCSSCRANRIRRCSSLSSILHWMLWLAQVPAVFPGDTALVWEVDAGAPERDAHTKNLLVESLIRHGGYLHAGQQHRCQYQSPYCFG